MKHRAIPALMLAVAGAFAQTRVPLEPVGTKQSAEKIRGLFSPLQCDREGNVYLRALGPGEKARSAMRTIRKFDRQGVLKAKFAFEASPEIAELDPFGFAVGPVGEIYVAAEGQDGDYIATFDRDGKYRSKVKLELAFRPSQIAVFKSGDFLVSGVEFREQNGKRIGAPLTAIFDGRGKLLRKVSVKGRVSTAQD